MASEKKPIGPVQAALAGGLFVGLGAAVVGQNLSRRVNTNMDLTLMVIGAGFVVGAILGVVITKLRKR